LSHARASGAPLEVKTRSNRRRWRARVIAMRFGWAQLLELDDLCRDLQTWIYRVADIEAVSLDAGDAYLQGLLNEEKAGRATRARRERKSGRSHRRAR